jgi:cation diffusion facilitator family transporter
MEERRALYLSAGGYLLMALLGIGFAMFAQSDAIMLSGFFSLVSFAIGLLTVKVSRLVEGPDDERFHFGYAWFEPFLNTVKSLIVFFVLGFALVSGIDALLHGGKPLQPGPALLYAVIAMISCLAIHLVTRRYATKTASPLLDVDAKNWLIDTVVNTGIGIAFLSAMFLEGSQWSSAVPYVDPLLTTVLVVVMIRIPARMIQDNLGEMLQAAPTPPVQTEVRERFDQTVRGLAFERTRIRMLKVGRFMYLLIHILVPAGFSVSRVEELDDIRQRIADGLEGVHPRLFIDTVFTEREEWAS